MPLVGIGTSPQPPTRRLVCPECAPSPLFLGGGEHSLARKGVGESQFRRRAYTVVLFICTYFVYHTHPSVPMCTSPLPTPLAPFIINSPPLPFQEEPFRSLLQLFF
jgi:hypothetical protein